MRSALISPGVEWPLRLLLGGGVTLLCVLAAACGDSASVAEAQRETEAWRAKHEADYRRDWSTIAGLHFLEQGSQAAGSAPGNRLRLPDSVPATIGRFVLAGEAVTFEPEPGAGVQLDGNAVEGLGDEELGELGALDGAVWAADSAETVIGASSGFTMDVASATIGARVSCLIGWAGCVV